MSGTAMDKTPHRPVLLTEVNFQAMFEAQQAQMAAAGQSNGEAIPN